MQSEVLVAIISFAGTAVGSIVAVVTANSLTNYKIEELRKQVEKHNTIIDRVYQLEAEDKVKNEETGHETRSHDTTHVLRGGR